MERRIKEIRPLAREFYLRGVCEVAPQLLGKTLLHRTAEGLAAGRIVEVEAYSGLCDAAAHSYLNKRTARTEIQFGPGGFAYIYAIYGLHFCFNVVANLPDKPEAVLVRALEPLAGLELMRRRRGVDRLELLCSGPGRLCQAMGIGPAQYGRDLCGSQLWVGEPAGAQTERIMVSPRINVDYAGASRDLPWRYFLADNPCVSKAAKRYREQERPYLQDE